jgi:2,4-dienoyl-CoA reductase-like NADH-dependent reductase (Old Yellow Enzyme family)
VEVVKAVRETTGDWPVTAKLNCEDGIEGGVTHDDVIYFAKRLTEAGIEALTISGGSPRREKRAKMEKAILPRQPPKYARLSAVEVKAVSPLSVSAAGGHFL